MFQFPRFPLPAYAFGREAPGLPRAGFPIRRPRDRGPCAPPPGLSRLAASFFGSMCQGIRRAPWISSRPADVPRGACPQVQTFCHRRVPARGAEPRAVPLICADDSRRSLSASIYRWVSVHPLPGVPIESISSSLSRHRGFGGASSLCGSQGARGRTPGTGHAGGRWGSWRGTRAHLRRNIVCEI